MGMVSQGTAPGAEPSGIRLASPRKSRTLRKRQRMSGAEAMIKVVKGKCAGSVYIGRGSPLGNPYVMRNQSPDERDRVCDAYVAWLMAKIANNDPEGVE